MQHAEVRAASPGRAGPAWGAAHGGADEPRQRVLTSARASVRPSAVCCWDCGPGEAPTGSDRPPSPLPQVPRPFGGLEEGRWDPGTGAVRAGGGGSCGARRGGAGVSAEPRPGGGRESAYPGEQRQLGMAPPTPFLLGPASELELVLDTLSGRWRGSLSEPGQGLPFTFGPADWESLHSAGALGSPDLQGSTRPKLPDAPGLWGSGVS